MSDEREDEGSAGHAVPPQASIELTDEIRDDVTVPFQAERAGARGRLVRLGSAVDKILTAHAYPEPVSNFLGEAIALTAMIGSSLKFDGKLILQTKTDGPIGMMVVDYTTPGQLRAYAGFDNAALEALDGADFADMSQWLGAGYMALTVDQGPDMERYQGIVALNGRSLAEAAEDYFQQSEQIPSLVRLHVAKHYSAQPVDGENWHWRAGGLMVQYLTAEGGTPNVVDAPGDGGEIEIEDDDNWRRARILGESVEAHELLDPQLAPERLLFRLYHEEGVRVYEKHELAASCSCSEQRVKAMLQNFSPDERHDMVEDGGKITVTCEFCNQIYHFEEGDFEA